MDGSCLILSSHMSGRFEREERRGEDGTELDRVGSMRFTVLYAVSSTLKLGAV